MVGFIESDGGRFDAGFSRTAPGDCATRAIALVSGKPYRLVWNDLTSLLQHRIHRFTPCMGYENADYGIFTEEPWFNDYLQDSGFRFWSGSHIGLRVERWAIPMGRYLLRQAGHMSTCINGNVVDAWDCRDNPIYQIWQWRPSA